MQSRNPVFSRNAEFQRGGYATFDQPVSDQQLQDMYNAPPATPTQMRRMTLDDVVMRTAAMFGVLLAFAVGAWIMQPPLIIVIGAAIAAFVVAMIVSFRRQVSVPLILAYAALEGVFVGAISGWYAAYAGSNIIGQAVIGTLAAFAAMLILYRTGRLRATPRFTKTLMIAGFAYLGIALVSLVSAFFGVGNGWGFYGAGPLGLLLCVAGVALASFFLILDFDFIEQGVRNGLPEKEAWRAGFGLMVTLVWLYLEFLRLFAILNSE
jgi:uncharacterized YccA/Bax inhibitor family protein